jgi:hypothetical protein
MKNQQPRSPFTPTPYSLPARSLLRSLVAASILSLSAAPATVFAAVPNPYGASAAADDNDGFGKLDPSQPSGITVDEIIRKFGERESAFNHARQNYIFRQSVKVQTISEDNNRPDGEYQQVTDITFDKTGRREERVVFAPQNTLERVMMTPADMEEIEHRLPFVLTAEEMSAYDIRYLGRQKVDDLDTYVFSAGPKSLEKGKHYFEGKVWVDQRDFQIVLVNGKTVPQDMRRGHEDLQPPFTTYYEQVDGKYWFPTYTKAEGVLHFPAGNGSTSQDVHMRNIVRYTDYKQFRTTSRIIYNGEDITNNKATPDDKDKKPEQPTANPPR